MLTLTGVALLALLSFNLFYGIGDIAVMYIPVISYSGFGWRLAWPAGAGWRPMGRGAGIGTFPLFTGCSAHLAARVVGLAFSDV